MVITWEMLLAFFAFMLILFLCAARLTAEVRHRALTIGRLDIPNERSSHTVPVPRGGGISIVATFLAGITIMTVTGWLPSNIVAVLVIGALVACIGYIDDHKPVAPLMRAAVHFEAAIAGVAAMGGVAPLDLGFVIWDWGWFGNLIAVVGVVWMINLYNFMDGIDGIASIEAIFVTIVTGFLLLATGNLPMALILFALAAAVAGFLTLNFPPAKIFMGDVSSGFLGYTLAVLALTSAKAGFNIWVWIVLLGVFIVDTFITLLRRLLRHEKWYAAHRMHAYQHATTFYKGHRPVLSGVLLIDVLWLAMGAILIVVAPQFSILISLIAYVPLVGVALYFGAGTTRPQ